MARASVITDTDSKYAIAVSYVQVAYTLGTQETREREFSALESLKTTSRKLLLSMDRLDLSDGDIRHEYIPDFLFAAT